MAGDTPHRALRDLTAVVHRGLDVPAFFAGAREVIGRYVPFDGCCWMTFDPATLLPTSHVAHESIRPEDVPRLAHNEYREDDVNKFAELARRPNHAGVLRDATHGRPELSARYRDILRPNGFADELRLACTREGTCWGGVAIYRAPDAGGYVPGDVEILAALGGLMAEGLRRAVLTGAVGDERGPDAPGLLLVDARDRVEAMTPPAARWLAELPAYGRRPEDLPSIVYPLIDRARRLAAGEEAGDAVARARVRTTSGRWIVLHGSVLAGGDGRAAVILEPARPPEIAPLIVGAYGLTEREQDITQLVMHGLPTAEIARTLHLSPYTVQDHLKAIFDKVGVRTRGELVAEVFFAHYAPRMGHGDNLGADGWFGEAPVGA